jgi:hypothetical protein
MVLLFEEFMPLLYSQLSAGVQNKATPAYFFSPRESNFRGLIAWDMYVDWSEAKLGKAILCHGLTYNIDSRTQSKTAWPAILKHSLHPYSGHHNQSSLSSPPLDTPLIVTLQIHYLPRIVNLILTGVAS